MNEEPDLDDLKQVIEWRKKASPELQWDHSKGFVDEKGHPVHKLHTVTGNRRRKMDGRVMAFLFKNALYLLGLAVRDVERKRK